MIFSSAELLSRGKCTGALLLPAANGVGKLRVRKGDRGRGLFAASPFKKGDVITCISGSIVPSIDAMQSPHSEKLQWSTAQVFVMEHSDGNFGIFANTAASKDVNNAKYVCSRRSKPVVRLCATRSIVAGQEILAPYGKLYVSKIKAAVILQAQRQVAKTQMLDAMAPVVMAGGAVARMLCAKCNKRVTAVTRTRHARFCTGPSRTQ